MRKADTTKYFIEKAKQLHNNKYDYSQTVYVNSRTKVEIICPEHGVFEQRASSHMQGNGCPKCAKIWSDVHRKNHIASVRKSVGFTKEMWVERVRRVHGDRYDYSQVVYENQRSMVKIICPKHGVFVQEADSHLQGHGCRLCAYELMDHSNYKWSDDTRQKIKSTCLERYGAERYLDSIAGREKVRKIKADVAFREKMRNIISSKEVQDKTKKTCVDRYGVDSAVKTEMVQNKIFRTKKKNHTVNSSKAEERANVILQQFFGADVVVHHFKDKTRYPFVCDFYIKSLDLFIEFNIHWSHGKHFYLSNVADSEVLCDWPHKAENSDYYKSAIETWTVRDVKKREIAVMNNLNYVVFWKNDLSDFKEWLNADKLVLNNIL